MTNFNYYEVRFVCGKIEKGSKSLESLESHYFLTKEQAETNYRDNANHYSFRIFSKTYEGIELYRHELEMSNEEIEQLMSRIEHNRKNSDYFDEYEINDLDLFSEGECIDCYYTDGNQEVTIEGIPVYELAYTVNNQQLDQWDFELLIAETDDCRLQSEVERASKEAINCDQTVVVEDKNNNLTIEIKRAKKGGAF